MRSGSADRAPAHRHRRPADRHRGEGHRPPGPRADHVTPAVQAERGIRSEQGALIFKISPQVSRATGLREGDVIVADQPDRGAQRPSRSQELLDVPLGRRRPALLRARRPDRLHRPRRSDDRRPLAVAARHPLRLAGDAAPLGRAAPHRALAPALARAGGGGAGAGPRDSRRGAGPDAGAPRRRRPRRRGAHTSAGSATT